MFHTGRLGHGRYNPSWSGGSWRLEQRKGLGAALVAEQLQGTGGKISDRCSRSGKAVDFSIGATLGTGSGRLQKMVPLQAKFLVLFAGVHER